MISLPKRVKISKIVSSRYGSGGIRPLSWDDRIDGVDIVKTTEGEELHLQSSGQQSTPQPSWEILLTSGDHSSGYKWTLYGMPRKQG